ncbi:MAG TPA: hypothetical protein VNT75_06460 [Symbiobacteriaceae bacterium]|nr:hypothetical protein [Symbiobacteriaceae bacterium]
MLRERLHNLFRLGQYAEILSNAETWFQQHGAEPALALWVATYACRAAAAERQWGVAVKWAEQAAALKVRDAEAEGYVQLSLGVAQMYLGNAFRAEKALAAFDRLASRSAKVRQLQPFADFNRAILMRFMRRHGEEVECLRRAAEGFAARNRLRDNLHCRLEIAWAHLLQSQPQLAQPELEEAARWLDAVGDDELQVDFRISWALCHKLTGDLEAAERLCQEVLQRDTLEPRQEAEALWILGCVAQARGDLALARQYGDTAYRIATQDYWPMQVERIEALRSVALAN